MHFFSTTDSNLTANFRQALLSGLAPDGGLYIPASIPRFSESELTNLSKMSFAALAAEVTKVFVGDEMPPSDIEAMCRAAYDFDIKLEKTSRGDIFLELFHGPTAAFKDVAGQFMGHSVAYFLKQSAEEKNILVATSGDTGGAIGAGFKNQPGVKVFILFPKGGVSSVQRQQLCTMGGNVHALEVAGTFDDCQALVKQAFSNHDFNRRYNLMSANSINVGRVIPQSFYYLWASLKLKAQYPNKRIVFSVPSGNLGNITGAYIAQQMGAPIEHLIVANNRNSPFVDFLKSGDFKPRPSVPTLSNAMDIGHPNNYYRLNYFFPDGLKTITKLFSGATYSDEKTAENLVNYFASTNYLMCPHTSVGHLATTDHQINHPNDLVVTVATAHPAKFRDEVEPLIGSAPILPESLAAIMDRTPEVTELEPNLDALEAYLKTTQQ